MQAERGPPKLALVPVLELTAQSLGIAAGTRELKVKFFNGRLVEARVLPLEQKLTREQLDLYVLEPQP